MSRHLSNHTELREKIQVLEASRKECEDYLSAEGGKVIALVSDPGTFIKELTQELARDKDFRKDLLKIGLSAGTNYLGRLIQSPAASEALFAFLFKKTKNEQEEKENLWTRLNNFLSNLTSTKQEQS